MWFMKNYDFTILEIKHECKALINLNYLIRNILANSYNYIFGFP
jgi:hypothetical protein